MDTSKLHEKLIAAGRTNAPEGRVPYLFEQRVMRQLAGAKVDPWAAWEQSLMRAALCSVVLMLALTTGSFFLGKPAQPAQSLSQDVEQTLFSAVDNGTSESGMQ
jgi:hypothetical protein